MKKRNKHFNGWLIDVAFKIHDCKKHLTASPQPSPKKGGRVNTQTKIDTYFTVFRDSVDKAMSLLPMKVIHKVSQAFVDVIEGNNFVEDIDGAPILTIEVGKDIEGLVELLVNAYITDRDIEKANEMFPKKFIERSLSPGQKAIPSP